MSKDTDKPDLGNDFTPTDDNDGKMSDKEVDAALDLLRGDEGDDKDKKDDKPDAKAKDDGKAKDKAEKDEPLIPKSRFDEQLNIERQRAEEAEDKLARERARFAAVLAGQDPDKPKQLTPEEQIATLDAEVDKQREAWEEALLDNDRKAAQAARQALTKAEHDLRELTTKLTEARARTGSNDDTRYNQTLTEIETEFPQINPDDKENFDKPLFQKVARLYHSLTNGGTDSITALLEAKEVYLDPLKEQEKQKKDGADDLEKGLRDQGKENVATAIKDTPVNLAEVGKTGSPSDSGLKPSRLTHEQYAKIPEKDRSRLRGDEFGGEAA